MGQIRDAIEAFQDESRTIAEAARIGKCRVEDFYEKLQPLGFSVASTPTHNKRAIPMESDVLERPAFMENLKATDTIVLDVRDPAFVDADLVALARTHGMALVYTDSETHPNVADPTADFVYARLMRARAGIATGYPEPELQAWAARARTWAGGSASWNPCRQILNFMDGPLSRSISPFAVCGRHRRGVGRPDDEGV